MLKTDPHRIVVTGGYGFIGSNLVLQLIAAGHTVLNIDCLTYAANPQSLSSVDQHPNYRFAKTNIIARDEVYEHLRQFKPTWIMHLAAETHVDRSIASADAFVDSNITGTYRLLDACMHYWQKLSTEDQKRFRFMHISTDEVYGSLGLEGCFTESSTYQPRSPYAASKAASDHLVNAWYETYRFPAIVTHSSNNYGPFQFPEKLIPMVIVKCLQRKPIPVYGTGENIRDWLYVADHCDALQRIITSGRIGETYNIGGQCELRNIDLVHQVCDLVDQSNPTKPNPVHSHSTKPSSELIAFVTDRPGHDFRYALNTQKVCRETGWQPSTDFTANLQTTVQWYLDHRDWWEPMIDRIS